MESRNYKFYWKMGELRENVEKTINLNKRMREIISNKSVINIIYSKKCVKLIEKKMKEIEEMNKEVLEMKNLVENLSKEIENGKRKKKYYSLGS